jgi:hypothetical protein
MKTIDALDHIRKHPEMYLVCGRKDGPSLAARLVSDVLTQGGPVVEAIQANDWWVVASETDWIRILECKHSRDPFTSIVPFPEDGPNSMHSEVLLTAFAQDVLTTGCEGRRVIKGKVSPSDPIWSRLSDRGWSRAVAFRLSLVAAIHAPSFDDDPRHIEEGP